MSARGTFGRVSGIGASAALLALLLWLLQRAYVSLTWPLALVSMLAGLCGAAILLITAADLLFHRRRGERVRPLRAFDIVLGFALVLLCVVQLDDLDDQIGLLW